ncbi:hypothetical protein JIP62_12345 [Brevundimonas vitis]|uniref:Lipoprotein n=1 Tax=Brevundimonas vitisensis TaxID=2800818 RepID=A0ABX7BPN6_9CAUL|nr:DUF6491 family protein [Brevundimonas vitisensis]QQQ18089.1 hypothetical protein JIP62_12345 [Brevundimonas vitisensis]
MRLAILIPAMALLGAMAGCAPTTQPDAEAVPRAQRACFLAPSLQNFRASDTTLYVRSSRSEVFEVQVAGYCQDLSSANSVSVTPFGGSSVNVCVGDTVSIALSGLGTGGRYQGPCRGEVQRKLTEAEVAALAPRLRP